MCSGSVSYSRYVYIIIIITKFSSFVTPTETGGFRQDNFLFIIQWKVGIGKWNAKEA